jgi:hypothetical protein
MESFDDFKALTEQVAALKKILEKSPLDWQKLTKPRRGLVLNLTANSTVSVEIGSDEYLMFAATLNGAAFLSDVAPDWTAATVVNGSVIAIPSSGVFVDLERVNEWRVCAGAAGALVVLSLWTGKR